MSRKHLGMKRPIRQFEKHYAFLLGLIEEIEIMNPESDLDKELYIARLKTVFNNALIQFNNIKNAQIELLERER